MHPRKNYRGNRESAQQRTSLEIQESLDNFLEEGIFQWSHDKKLVFANNTFLRMFGFSIQSHLSEVEVTDLFADDEAALFLIDKIHAEGIILKHRLLCRRKDRTNFWTEISGRKVIRRGQTLFQGTIADISDLISVEDKLRQKEAQLEKLSMEMDRFIYSASHEIRSPVCTLTGIINLMKYELNDDPASQYTVMLETSVGRLDHIVRQLTAHARNFKEKIDDKQIDFQLLLTQTLNEFRESHEAYKMIRTSFELKGTALFYSDPGRLQMILSNVLKNCFDYFDIRKTIKVLSISVQTKSEGAYIEIFDNGIGIAASHVDRVFEMFYRATDMTRGSGIGLYTVREVVTKLGGMVSLFSEFGVGTSVIIELPNSRTGKLINRKSQLRAMPR